MKIINQYLAKEVYTTLLVVLLVLLAIFLSHQLVHFMHLTVMGNLPIHSIRILLLLQLPILLAVLLPVGLYLAILLAYGRLYADSEMIILITSGVSPLKILKNTCNFSVIVVIFIAILSLWINPKIYRYSDTILSGAVPKTIIDMVKPNIFTPILKDKLIFYVDSVSQNKEQFSSVFVAEQLDQDAPNQKNKLKLVMAKNAYQKTNSDTGDLYIILTDGYRYVGTPGEKDYEIIKYNEYALQVQQDVKTKKLDVSSASTLKLWQNRHNKFAIAELHWRIALPLSALILTLLGTALSKVKPRHGRYAKVIPAILLYITYANFLFLAKAWIKSGAISPILGMWWAHGIMLLTAYFLLKRQL
jgi:lipopolysaccharide export system permease protein